MQPTHLFTEALGAFGRGSLGGSCDGRGGGDGRRRGRWDGMGSTLSMAVFSTKMLVMDLTFSNLNVLLFYNHNRHHDNNTII